jgi:hypothetical protein
MADNMERSPSRATLVQALCAARPAKPPAHHTEEDLPTVPQGNGLHRNRPAKITHRVTFQLPTTLLTMGKAWCTKIDSASSQALIGTGAETRNAIRRRVATEFDWKLVTDLPIRSRQDTIEKLQWYAMRWKIETFHKIFKSGFKAEEVRLRAAERIVNLIAILCLLSWRVFWMTMINRTLPEAVPCRNWR